MQQWRTWLIVAAAAVLGFGLGWWARGTVSHSTPSFETLLAQLKSADPIQRTESAWAIAAHPKPEMAEELAKLLLDREDHVRLAAAVALARIGEPAIVPMLRVVREATEQAAKNPRQPFHFLPGQFFRQPQEAAEFVLTHIARSSEGAKVVAKLLESRDPNEVALAQRALHQVGPIAFKTVLPYLNHQRREVRLAALSVLSGGGEQAIDVLRRFIIESKEEPKTLLDQEVRQMAVYTLGNTRSDKALPVLKEALKNPLLETAAWQAIGNLRTESAKRFLAEQVEHFAKGRKKPPTALLHAVGAAQLTEALPFLRQWLQSADPRVQEAAALAIGMLRDQKSLPLLIPLLTESKDTGVAAAAATAIGQIADPQSLPALYKVLEQAKYPAQTQVVINALTAIQSINERSAIPVIEKFLTRSDLPDTVRQHAEYVRDMLQRMGRP